MKKTQKNGGPRVLFLDIETAPILGYCWGLWENNIALNQIHTDWYILSWAARWQGDPVGKVLYQDQRKAKDIENDKALLQGIWKLLDEADIIVTQNGKAFDQKKLFARFILNGMQPPSTFKHIDTKQIASKHFKFTSNKLEYMTDKLCTKYKKVKHAKFGGFELWKQCLAGNIKAWNEMKIYNQYDVLSLEELYTKLIPWDGSIDFNVYTDSTLNVCKCGSDDIKRNGYAYTSKGKYHRYKCLECGSETRGRENLLSDEKKASLRARTR
jgi:hypothetical protein